MTSLGRDPSRVYMDSYNPAGSDLPTLRNWVEFHDITQLWTNTTRTTQAAADGDQLKGVTDKSGKSSHWAQATGANAPTLKLAQIGNKPCARFTRANANYITASSFTVTQLCTFLVLIRHTSFTGTQTLFDGDNTNSYRWKYSSTGLVVIDQTATANLVPGGGYIPKTGQWMVQAFSFDGNYYRLYEDGAPILTALAATTGVTMSGGQTTAGSDTTPANHLNADIGSWRIYDAAVMSTAQIKLASAHMFYRAGIAHQLVGLT